MVILTIGVAGIILITGIILTMGIIHIGAILIITDMEVIGTDTPTAITMVITVILTGDIHTADIMDNDRHYGPLTAIAAGMPGKPLPRQHQLQQRI